MRNLLGLVGAAMVAAGALAAEPFTLRSSSFSDNAVLPPDYAGNIATNPNCTGTNTSPQLSWSNTPVGTQSFVLFMIDLDGRSGAGVNHWVAYGIPPSRTGFAEGEAAKPPVGYLGGKSSQGLPYYMGPCTPPNTTYHHYTFVVLATDLAPDAVPAGLTREELLPYLQNHVKGASSLVGRFRHR